MSDPTVTKIAAKHKKTPGQVLLRWAIQLDYIVLPKSVHHERVIENADCFDFTLDKGDMDALYKLDDNGNVGGLLAGFASCLYQHSYRRRSLSRLGPDRLELSLTSSDDRFCRFLVS
jgi:hypothetical protein